MKFWFKLLIFNVFLTGSLFALPIGNIPTFEYEGAYDYFILSKSLLANTAAYSEYEPQGDTSIGAEGASDFLLETDIPKDAVIEQAFLVWFASVNDADSMMFTDNQVTLMTPDGEDHTVTASLQGNSASPQGFEFESYYKNGYYYYVYRVDVTNIIADFQYNGENGGIRPLVGEYKVSGVDDIYDCAKSGEKHNYCQMASMIGGWQLILIYGSSQIARKRIYLYNGLDWSANTNLNPTTITIGNFELPEKAAVKVSFVTADGDDYIKYPEYLEVKGGLAAQSLVLGEVGDGTCNPLNQPFNSKFRTVNHKGEVSECREELSFDIDTFFLQYDENVEDSIINPHVQYGTTSMDFYIKTGADIISNSWGPADNSGQTVDMNQTLKDLVANITTTGRNGLGTIILFAAGNGGESIETDGYASNPNVFAIGASNASGNRASYSDFGNSLDFMASSCDIDSSGGDGWAGGGSYVDGIWTTDNMGSGGYNSGNMNDGDALGNYTNSFGGTSSACPLAAGITGLVLFANPDLTKDQVYEIYKETSDKIGFDAYDVNGFNMNYGYGRINACEAVKKALEMAGTNVSGIICGQDITVPDPADTADSGDSDISDTADTTDTADSETDSDVPDDNNENNGSDTQKKIAVDDDSGCSISLL